MVDDVAGALTDTWQMLAGTPRSFVLSEASPDWRADDCYFTVRIWPRGGATHTAVLQISRVTLQSISCAMFDRSLGSVTDTECQDVGKELTNILSSCCIHHIPVMEDSEEGLPKIRSCQEIRALMETAEVLVCFTATEDGDPLSLTVVATGEATVQEDDTCAS